MWDEGREIARRLRAWEAGETPGPYTLELYPTLRCNLGCVYCDTRYRDARQRDALGADELAAIVDEAAAIGVRRVMLLGGGEPLLARADCVALMRRVKRAGMEGVLTTNGTLLDERTAGALVDAGWDEVQVSIDAADPRVNDYLRGTPGALLRAARNVCRLSARRRAGGDAQRPRVVLHAVLTSKNADQLEPLVRLADALGAQRLNVDALIAYRAEQRALQMTGEQLEALPARARRAAAVADELGLEHDLTRLADRRATDRGAMQLPLDGPSTLAAAPCLNPWYHLVVDAAGQVSSCCVITGTGEDVRERGVQASWVGGPVLDELRRRMLAKDPPARCRECSMAMISRNDALRDELGRTAG